MNNLLSYCGLVDAKTRASDKDLRVINGILFLIWHSEQFMYTTCSELEIFIYWSGDSMNNLLSYCGLVDAKIRASDNYLPVKGSVRQKRKVSICCPN